MRFPRSHFHSEEILCISQYCWGKYITQWVLKCFACFMSVSMTIMLRGDSESWWARPVLGDFEDLTQSSRLLISNAPSSLFKMPFPKLQSDQHLSAPALRWAQLAAYDAEFFPELPSDLFVAYFVPLKLSSRNFTLCEYCEHGPGKGSRLECPILRRNKQSISPCPSWEQWTELPAVFEVWLSLQERDSLSKCLIQSSSLGLFHIIALSFFFLKHSEHISGQIN